MALCNQLEEERTVREDTRDRLTKGSLTRLFDTRYRRADVSFSCAFCR